MSKKRYYIIEEKQKKESSYGKKLIAILSVAAVFLVTSVTVLSLYFTGVISSSGGYKDKKDDEKNPDYSEGFVDYVFNSDALPAGRYATFVFKVEGDENEYKVKAYLFDKYAPNTVSNFVSHASKGTYDGTVFSNAVISYDSSKKPVSGRIDCGPYTLKNGEPTYVMPTGTNPKPIKGEFKNNGYEQNVLSHTAGVIGLTHGASNDDATTDFYILPYDAISMNGNYAAFGKITTESGIKTVQSLAKKSYEQNLTVTLVKVTIETKKS